MLKKSNGKSITATPIFVSLTRKKDGGTRKSTKRVERESRKAFRVGSYLPKFLIMAINLRDIPEAVQNYMNTKVTVSVSNFTPAAGDAIGPNELFTFKVKATNANAAGGGIMLKNVRYRIQSTNAAVAKIKVPADGTSTNLAGVALAVGTEVEAFIYSPSAVVIIDPPYTLSVGDTDTISLTGRAGAAPAGGTTNIQARILADVDLDLLFPKNEDTPMVFNTVTVVG